MKNADQLAYPVTTVEHTGFSQTGDKIYSSHTEGGLTKREMFAMAAMQGILSNSSNQSFSNQCPYTGMSTSDKAAMAVHCADELLNKLES